MSKPTLQSMADLGYKFASDLMVGTKKELMPMFVIQRGEQVEVIGTPFSNDEEKRIMVVNVALEIVEKGADAWSFLSETWFAHRKPNEPIAPRPSQDPNRLEGVLCLVSDGQTTQMHGCETKRDAEGNCTELVKQEEGPHTIHSWISQALNRAMKLHNVLKGGGDIREAVEALRAI